MGCCSPVCPSWNCRWVVFTARGVDEGGERGVTLQSAPSKLQVGCFTARGVDEGGERGFTLQSAPPRITDDLFLPQGVLMRVEKGVLLSSLPLLELQVICVCCKGC